MIARAKAWGKRHWPRLRLRTIVFATLFVVAALPGIGAVFLRVYENTLVRQSEGELVAQGAALAATAAGLWPGARPAAVDPQDLRPEPPTIDLRTTPILPERPAPRQVEQAPDRAAILAAARLAPIVAATRQTTLAAILLLDSAGRPASAMPPSASYAVLPEVRAALAGTPRTVLRHDARYRAVHHFEWLSRAAAIRVHHARPIIVDGRVVGVLLLSRSARALFRGLYEDRGKIMFGIAVILVMLIALSGILSRGITRPIEALSNATRAVASGRGQVPQTPPTAAIEIQGLYADFATMAAEIDRRSRYLRDFAHAVSHEFKTPLAGIRGAIELLLDHDGSMTPDERRRFLANADADADRLAQLVSRLLELARADMTPIDNAVATDPVPIIAHIADAWMQPGFTIDWPDHALPPVAVPHATLEAALSTLFENSRQSGASRVRIFSHATDTAMILTLVDDGHGIPDADRARIFEPFFTTRRASGGTGLGLAIVASLLNASRGRIELAETLSPGTAFTLHLPLAR